MKIKNVDYQMDEKDLQRWVEEELSRDFDGGELESMRTNIRNLIKMNASLINIFAEKGMLSASEVSKIVSGYDREFEFVQ